MLIAGDFNLKLNKANEFLDLMNIWLFQKMRTKTIIHEYKATKSQH
jgi:hypothetical protein